MLGNLWEVIDNGDGTFTGHTWDTLDDGPVELGSSTFSSSAAANKWASNLSAGICDTGDSDYGGRPNLLTGGYLTVTGMTDAQIAQRQLDLLAGLSSSSTVTLDDAAAAFSAIVLGQMSKRGNGTAFRSEFGHQLSEGHGEGSNGVRAEKAASRRLAVKKIPGMGIVGFKFGDAMRGVILRAQRFSLAVNG